jgi:dipeptidyl aminopeptidase/acylaminoacyl peptidase
MLKKLLLIPLILLLVGSIWYGINNNSRDEIASAIEENLGGLSEEKDIHPLQISEMRKAEYPGSEITIEQNLADGSNYKRYIASYKSEGLKIFGLLTVPTGEVPAGGWPIIVFNHGYIQPEIYSTTEKYVAYQDGFARNGYVTFKSDYRGHGNSEGKPEGAYYSTAYTTDVLNAVSSLKKLSYINPEKIGMWGHSMGGHITLRSMVVTDDIKAGVIWGGVVASYQDMAENWRRTPVWRPSPRQAEAFRPTRQQLIDKYGDWNTNPDFWNSISPIKFVSDISGPIQLDHGLADESVPWEFSESLNKALGEAGKTVEYYTYPGTDHNLSGSAFGQAMSRSIAFFDKYLKN